MKAPMLALALTILMAGCAAPASRWDDPAPTPEAWVDTELAPALARMLATHPRFSGETVAIGLPTRVRDGYSRLEQRLEGTLESRLVHGSGLRLRAPGLEACGTGAAYALGFVVRPVRGESRVELRVLELRSGEWVSGVADSWQGMLSRRDLADQAAPAEPARRPGSPAEPFGPGDTERAAQALAQELSCRLVEARLAPGRVSPADDRIARLTAGYLATLGHARSGAEDWTLDVRREAGGPGLERLVATLASPSGVVTSGAWMQTPSSDPPPVRPVSFDVSPPVARPPVLAGVDCGPGCVGFSSPDADETVFLAVIPGRGLATTRGCPVRIDRTGRSVTTVPAPHATWARFYALRAAGSAESALERLAARLPSACSLDVLPDEGRWLGELGRIANDAGPSLAWSTTTARAGHRQGEAP